jgi:DNA-binding transcriptional regulator/RsmH inhibitor MraZ
MVVLYLGHGKQQRGDEMENSMTFDKSGQNAIQRVTMPAAYRDEFDEECIRDLWVYALRKNRKNPLTYRTELELADKLVEDINAQFKARKAAQKERQDDEVLAFQHINFNE